MTGKTDFTEQERETVLEAPTSAGLIVSTAQRGGSLRESFPLAKAYAETRTATGEELEDCRRFTLGLAERAAIDEISATLGEDSG